MTGNDPLWHRYARGIRPLRVPKDAPPQKAVVETTPISKAAPPRRLPAGKPAPKRTDMPADGPRLERNREKALRQGDLTIDARLDLHGLMQAAARAALLDFIAQAVTAHHRCVLIITGKGRDGTGVLRAALRGWLKDSALAPHILALRPASPKHGGGGAFYLIIRRARR